MSLLVSSSWALWLFLPAMRYMFFPVVLETRLGSYFVLVPLLLLCGFGAFLRGDIEAVVYVYFAAGLLIVMLSIDLFVLVLNYKTAIKEILQLGTEVKLRKIVRETKTD